MGKKRSSPHGRQSQEARIVRALWMLSFVGAFLLLTLFTIWSDRTVAIIFNAGQPVSAQFKPIVDSARLVVLFSAAALAALGGLGVWKQQAIAQGLRKHREVVAGVIVLGATVILLLVIGEIAARVLVGDQTFDGGGAAHKKQLATIPYNSFGLRGGEFPLEKPAGTVRIVALGDSFTFGHGIGNESAPWPAALETMLNEDSGAQYQIINTGKNGFQTRDELAALNDSLRFSPDIVILGYFFNDAETDDMLRSRQQEQDGSIIGRVADGAHLLLFSKSYLYGFVKVRWTSLRINLGMDKGYIAEMNDIYRLHPDELTMHKQQLVQVRDLAESANATFLIVVLPVNHEFDNYPLRDGHAFMESFCRESNTTCVDLLPVFIDEDYTRTRLNKYDSHPSEYGHRLIAAGIRDSAAFSQAIRASSRAAETEK